MSESQPPNVPPNWRSNWRPPKPRRDGPSRARARGAAHAVATAVKAGVIPSQGEMYDIAVRTCIDVAQDEDQLGGARVQAARTLAELATRGKLGGDAEDYDSLPPEEIEARKARIIESWAAERGMRLLPANVKQEKEPDDADHT